MVPGAAEAAALQSHSHSWAGPPCELAHSGGIPMSQMMHHDVYTELSSSATSGYGVNIHGVAAPGPAPHPHASMGYVSMMPSHEPWPSMQSIAASTAPCLRLMWSAFAASCSAFFFWSSC